MRRTWLGSVCLAAVAALVLAAAGSAGEKKAEGPAKKAETAPAGGVQTIQGKLTDDDPVDAVTKHASNVHKVELTKGKTYRIDMRSTEIDSFLRLEDAKGDKLAMDDDSGGFPNARIIYAPKESGTYRVITTCFDNKRGKYTLTIRQAAPEDLLAQQVQKLPKLPKAEQEKVLRVFAADLAKRADKLNITDLRAMMQVAQGLEFADNPKLAAEAYREFGKILEGSNNTKFAMLGKTLTAAARRVSLVGNPIAVHGQTLEGKDFDWGKYKGKVVLVDFWATWCGPCRAEIPNIKKLYETYHKRGFDVVAVSLDQGKDAPIKYMKTEKLPWTCLFDAEPGKGQEPLAEYYGIFSIPQAILVDRDGKVVSMRARGPELRRLLEKYLGPAEDEKKGDSSK